MQVKALKDLHVPGHKTIKKDTEFDTKTYGIKDGDVKTLKEKKLLEEVKETTGA